MELDGLGVAVSDVVVAVVRHGTHVHLSAAGMGPPVEAEVVRAMMFLRARTPAFGASGARPQVAETLVRLINAGVVPVVPEHGSLGASGEIAPLAHAALVPMGEGEVLADNGDTISGAEALAAAGIEPLVLAEKEGLALTNGTDGILGMLCLAVHDLAGLLRVADIVAACGVEALLATDRAFAADLLALRPHPGQQASAANLRALLSDGRVESCGNFHGAPVALAPDYLAIESVPPLVEHGPANAVAAARRGDVPRDLLRVAEHGQAMPDLVLLLSIIDQDFLSRETLTVNNLCGHYT